MAVDPAYFGVTGFAFPVVEADAGTGTGGGCDCPAVGDVRAGVVYDDGTSTGTLVIPAEADVRAGVGYGTGGTEYEGSLVVPGPPGEGTDHSAADVLRWLLVAANQLSDPAAGGEWPGFVASEPDRPDRCVVLTDTAGRSDGRMMVGGGYVRHEGVQIKVRHGTPAGGHAKAKALADYMATVLARTVYVGAAAYFVPAVTTIGQVIPLGKDRPRSSLSAFTVNVTMTFTREDT